MGTLRPHAVHIADQFVAVSDAKLRMTLVALSDRYAENIRTFIYRTYQDNELAALYRAIRASGINEHGGASKVRRKVIDFPNPYVADFVDTVLSELYGKEWLRDKKALRHDLVRPWWVVARL